MCNASIVTDCAVLSHSFSLNIFAKEPVPVQGLISGNWLRAATGANVAADTGLRDEEEKWGLDGESDGVGEIGRT